MEWLRWVLFIGLLAACFSQDYRFSLTKCNNTSTIDLVEGQAASITCTGLVWQHNIYWTVTSPRPNNVETTVGRCRSCVDYPRTCSNPCVYCNQACSNTTLDYHLSRTQQFTTLHFTTVLQSDDGAVIKCSSRDNRSQASCTINVIKDLNQNEGSPVASVAGGVVAAVVVIGTIIVVVIIIIKRKRSLKSPRTERNEEFVEYTNEFYDSTGETESQTSDVLSSTHPPPTSSQNVHSPQNTDQFANHERMYVNAGAAAAAAATNHSGDVYATVAKKTKNETPDLQSKQTQNNPNKTYAQVQKKKPKGGNSYGQAEYPAQKTNRNGKHGTGNEEAEVTEYADCPKESMGENSGAVYMNMAQASSPEGEEEVKRGSETDEYNKLRLRKTDAQEAKSPYNHLGDV